MSHGLEYLSTVKAFVTETKQFEGGKITEGKLNYELYWDFITLIAERMAKNKHKYVPYAWKKPSDIEALKQAYFRHTLEIMKGNYNDEGNEYHHIAASVANLMMIYYQLKNNGSV